jgi:hypothetical protein
VEKVCRRFGARYFEIVMRMAGMYSLKTAKAGLLAGSIACAAVMVALTFRGELPLAPVDFVLVSGIAFLLALFRPGFAFAVFIAWLPLETVNLVPTESIGIMLRPYQWLGALVLLAVLARRLVGRLPFALPTWYWMDGMIGILLAGSFVATLVADRAFLGANFKQSVVLFSFVALYALTRIFVRTLADVRHIAPFFAVSGVGVALFAVWQNIRFEYGLEAFEVMPGRPNATLTEADWLGVFLGVCLAAMYALLLSGKRIVLVVFALLCIDTALLLTVARSAWLAALLVTLQACVVVLLGKFFFPTFRRSWQWKRIATYVGIAVAAGVASVGLTMALHLTTFSLFQRAQSATSGLQSVTVACDRENAIPEKIASIEELAPYGCRHINLEEVETALSEGRTVRRVLRDDPNVNIRKTVYLQTIDLVREHGLFGVGFGQISSFFGRDERGAGLNTSNLFAEIWLGTGGIGALAFVTLWLGIAVNLMRRARRVVVTAGSEAHDDETTFFLLLSWVGLTVCNLFNAGLMLGFFWVWLAIAVAFARKSSSFT